MDKLATFEKKKVCCNPFEKKDHKPAETAVRKVSADTIVNAIGNHKITWMTTKMCLCASCRIDLTAKPSTSRQNIEEARTPMAISNPATETKTPSSTSTAGITSPSTGGSNASASILDKQLENYEKLKKIADILGCSLPPFSRLDPSSGNYRAATEEETCLLIQKSCKLLFPGKCKDSQDDLSEIIANMKTEMGKADRQEVLKLLKLLPKRWPVDKTSTIFQEHMTDYLKRQLSNSKITVTGITLLPEQRGRPSIKVDINAKVVEYFRRDDVSRPFPGMKDVISVKQADGTRFKFQKRLLLGTLPELHKTYLETCSTEEEKISLSSFKRLRPKECVFAGDSSAQNVCVCMIHENTKFFIQGLVETDCFEQKIDELQKMLTGLMLCEDPLEACKLRDCDKCDISRMIDFVTEKLDQKNVKEIKFSLWVTSPRCDLTSQVMDVDEFVDCLQMQLKKFVVHKFKVQQQTEFIEKKKQTLCPNKTIMCQLDFAENYTCEIQNAIQGAYFSKQQVTIHPIVIYYRVDEHSKPTNTNVVFISDERAHNSILVYSFITKLNEYLKERFPHIEEVLYLSDGCAEQYKNKSNFKNVCCHQKDFGIKAEWHFWPTSHGKGPCDGVGGTVKRRAREASLRASSPDQQINGAQQFFDWAKKQKDWKNWEFFFITKDDYEKNTKYLEERFSDLATISGTQRLHQFIPKDENYIYANEYSGQSLSNEEQLCFYLHKRKANDRKKRRSDSVDNKRKIKALAAK